MQCYEDKILIKNMWECKRLFADMPINSFSIRIGKDKHWTSFRVVVENRVARFLWLAV